MEISEEKYIAWETRIEGELTPLVNQAVTYLQTLFPVRSHHIVDIGSNTGMFSRMLLERVPGLTGTLFEPIKPYLYRALDFLDPSEWVGLPHALSDRVEEYTLWMSHTDNLGWNTIIKDRTNKKNNKECIRGTTVTFDSLFPPHSMPTPSIIKIDVEGYEGRVLNGMREHLSKWNPLPIILCEVGWGTNHPFFEETKDALLFLDSVGYIVPEVPDHTSDMFFIPVEREAWSAIQYD